MKVIINNRKYKHIVLSLLSFLGLLTLLPSVADDYYDITLVTVVSSFLIGFILGIGSVLFVLRWMSLHQESQETHERNKQKLEEISQNPNSNKNGKAQ